MDHEADEQPEMTTILVVDDDATVREVVARYLGRDGHQGLERANGVDGLAAALTKAQIW